MTANPYQPPTARTMQNKRPFDPSMSPRNLFGVIVRTLGLGALTYGIWGLAGVAWPEGGYVWTDYFVGSSPLLLMGFIFFFWADAVVALSYRASRPPIEDNSSPDQQRGQEAT